VKKTFIDFYKSLNLFMTVMFERSTEMEWSVVKQRLNTNRKKRQKDKRQKQ